MSVDTVASFSIKENQSLSMRILPSIGTALSFFEIPGRIADVANSTITCFDGILTPTSSFWISLEDLESPLKEFVKLAATVDFFHRLLLLSYDRPKTLQEVASLICFTTMRFFNALDYISRKISRLGFIAEAIGNVPIINTAVSAFAISGFFFSIWATGKEIHRTRVESEQIKKVKSMWEKVYSDDKLSDEFSSDAAKEAKESFFKLCDYELEKLQLQNKKAWISVAHDIAGLAIKTLTIVGTLSGAASLAVSGPVLLVLGTAAGAYGLFKCLYSIKIKKQLEALADASMLVIT